MCNLKEAFYSDGFITLLHGDVIERLRDLPDESVHCVVTSIPYRTFRNSDLWFQSISSPHGMVGVDDELVGLDVNPAGFSAEFCTRCGEYFDGAGKKVIKVRDGKRVCPCGRSDAWLSHFATFPKALVTPLIKIGTSEHGVCAECEAPHKRMTETKRAPRRQVESVYAQSSSSTSHGQLSGTRWDEPDEKLTTGWQKTCKCSTDRTVPAIVLDPFSGAATTAIVAKRLGRRAIGIDLNKDYLRMSIERIQAETAMPLFDDLNNPELAAEVMAG